MKQGIVGCVLLSLPYVFACGGTSEPITTTDETFSEASSASGDDGSWPRELVTTEGSGPALYLREDGESPAVGYVSSGVSLRVAGSPANDRIPVIIEGPLKVRGWLLLSRLGARAQRRGRVPGTPTYLGPNDVVRLRGPGAEPDLMRIEVSPRLGREGAPMLGPFSGEFPAEFLGAGEVDLAAVQGPSEGRPHRLPPGTEVSVYDRPGGQVVATLPALTPPLSVAMLRERGSWKGVRVGQGPYLVGYVEVALMPDTDPPTDTTIGVAASGDLPARIAAESERPLWAIAPGTRVRFDGRVIGLVRENGFARELHRYDQSGETDVFVAVDDTLAIRGMVRSAELVAPPAGLAPVVAPPVEASPVETPPAAAGTVPPPAPSSPGDHGGAPTPSQPLPAQRSPLAPVPSVPDSQ